MKHGKFQGRIEDARLVTGQGTYVDDLNLDGMVHGFMFRAGVPGNIDRLDVSDARNADGVLGIWTADDLTTDGQVMRFPC